MFVDKTLFAKKLIDEGKHYFLSRPRRFGKSLFVNTLEHIFKGNKELFKECQIYKSDYDWQTYPVLHFNFSRISTTSQKNFKLGIEAVLKRIGKSYEIDLKGPSVQFKLEVLIEKLAQKNRVVVSPSTT